MKDNTVLVQYGKSVDEKGVGMKIFVENVPVGQVIPLVLRPVVLRQTGGKEVEASESVLLTDGKVYEGRWFSKGAWRLNTYAIGSYLHTCTVGKAYEVTPLPGSTGLLVNSRVVGVGSYCAHVGFYYHYNVLNVVARWKRAYIVIPYVVGIPHGVITLDVICGMEDGQAICTVTIAEDASQVYRNLELGELTTVAVPDVNWVWEKRCDNPRVELDVLMNNRSFARLKAGEVEEAISSERRYLRAAWLSLRNKADDVLNRTMLDYVAMKAASSEETIHLVECLVRETMPNRIYTSTGPVGRSPVLLLMWVGGIVNDNVQELILKAPLASLDDAVAVIAPRIRDAVTVETLSEIARGTGCSDITSRILPTDAKAMERIIMGMVFREVFNRKEWESAAAAGRDLGWLTWLQSFGEALVAGLDDEEEPV